MDKKIWAKIVRYRSEIAARNSINDFRSFNASSNSSEVKKTFQQVRRYDYNDTLQVGSPAVLRFVGLSLAAGFAAGRYKTEDSNVVHINRIRPTVHLRSSCNCDGPSLEFKLSNDQEVLPRLLSTIVGEDNVIPGLVENASNSIYLKGARLGRGKALAIVTPGSMQEAVKALELSIRANCVVLPQGRNTGLTGGSVPREKEGNNRPCIIINMKKLDVIFPIDNGERVVCLAGAGIATLANNLKVWGFNERESHSTLGSTFLNPTTAAGVAFGSGGTQLRKGPAYTDRALYAKVYQDKWGKHCVKIVNTLGIEGIEDFDFHEGKGSALEQLDIYARDVKMGYKRPMASSSESKDGKAMASDRTYPSNVCECGDDQSGYTISRSNADTKGEHCNRSEGKVLILATVHDTFPKASDKKTFWVSFEDFETSVKFRKEVCLNNPIDLPISMEYMDRDAFDVIDTSGRILGNLIKIIGIGSFMGVLWNIKLKIESLPFNGAELLCDKILHKLNHFTPAVLPARFMESGKKMDHHLAITVGEFGNGEKKRFLERMSEFKNENKTKITVLQCQNCSEEISLNAFRFVAAPAFRTWCVGENAQGISVDYALPKNSGSVPSLGIDNDGNSLPLKRMRYSHFGCNVVHEDLAYTIGVDTHSAKLSLKKEVEHSHRGKLPAEHGHGIEYSAPKSTQQRWMEIDPLNIMNPGIGGLSCQYKYGKE